MEAKLLANPDDLDSSEQGSEKAMLAPPWNLRNPSTKSEYENPALSLRVHVPK